MSSSEDSLPHPAPPGAVASDRTQHFKKIKRRLLFLFALGSFLQPIFVLLTPENQLPPLQLVGALILSLIVYLWCRYDAAEVRRKIPRLVLLLIILAAAIGFPIYLAAIRRYTFGHAVSIMLLWCLIYIGLYCGGLFTFYYLFQWAGIPIIDV